MGKHMIALSTILLLAVWVIVVQTPVSAGEEGEEAQHMYIGVAKCKTCHKTAAQGEQFVIWEKSQHAKAYETLAGDEAKAIAKEKGIEDPQKADECLQCHVTGHGAAAELLGPKYLATDGVGCESCHGAGGDYYKKKTMVAITTGEMDRAEVGLIKPDEKTCTGCHNDKSPSFEGFDYEKMVAKITHSIPEERMEKYKTATE
jgi:hypothetical protein